MAAILVQEGGGEGRGERGEERGEGGGHALHGIDSMNT